MHAGDIERVCYFECLCAMVTRRRRIGPGCGGAECGIWWVVTGEKGVDKACRRGAGEKETGGREKEGGDVEVVAGHKGNGHGAGSVMRLCCRETLCRQTAQEKSIPRDGLPRVSSDAGGKAQSSRRSEIKPTPLAAP